MKIKKKVAVWCSLFALLVGLVPTCSARAEDDEYTFVEWCVDNGYSAEVSVNETSSEHLLDVNDGLKCMVIKYNDETSSNYGKVRLLKYSDSFYWYVYGGDIRLYNSSSGTKTCVLANYLYDGVGWVLSSCKEIDIYAQASYCFSASASNYDFLYSDKDVYANYWQDGIYFSKSAVPVKPYTFEDWCADAGFNCSASNSSSADEDFFVYAEDCFYLVMKNRLVGADIEYSLVQITKNEPSYWFPYYSESGGTVGLASLSEVSEYPYAKFYYYDGAGWAVSDTGASYEVSSLYSVPSINVRPDSANSIVYTSHDIFDGISGSNVYMLASTEYFDVGSVVPTVTPTPNPTVAPSGGSMITYKPALSGEVDADSLNMRKEATVNSEAVASFIKTWSLTLHGYVQNEDGVWYFCTAERDGQTYTGYVLSDYVKIVGGGVGSDGASTLDETLAQALAELESLALFVARVPMVIGIIFSFMPAWCLGLLGISFIFLVLGAISRK